MKKSVDMRKNVDMKKSIDMKKSVDMKNKPNIFLIFCAFIDTKHDD